MNGILLKPTIVGPYAVINAIEFSALTAAINFLVYLTTVCIVIAGAAKLAIPFQSKQSVVDITKLFEYFLASCIYYL